MKIQRIIISNKEKEDFFLSKEESDFTQEQVEIFRKQIIRFFQKFTETNINVDFIIKSEKK